VIPMTLIEPRFSGADLLSDIAAARPMAGQVASWRLGQAGILCRFHTATVVIDPYLSNHCEAMLGAPFDHRRLTRAPLDGSELHADVILCTHDHLDHLDPPTLRSAARRVPQPTIVVPKVAETFVAALGWKSPVAMNGNDSVRIGDLTIVAIPVPHEQFDETDGSYPYLGYVISDGLVTVAHLGDAVAHDSIRDNLKRHDVDVLFTPINGRDEKRRSIGFAGNMNATEALQLAHAVGARYVVPIHYDMFAQNVDPGAVATFIAGAERLQIPTAVLEVGERLVHPQPPKEG
jgi:L-ascorbate 6-phosphate lactonase